MAFRFLNIALLLAAGPSLAGGPAGSLVVCDDVRDPATLDPHKQFTEKNHALLQQVFEGLVRFGPDGAIEPALARRWERLDPLRMRFHLRRGVEFHDGEPFDAEAVRLSIERYLDPATASPAAGFLDPLSHAVVVDTGTVDLVTSRPDGLLLNRLAGFVLIVGARALRERGPDALAERPIGTGAFRFERWDKGRAVVLTANDRYWDPGRPKLRRLEFRFLPEARQLGALLSGEVDLLPNLPGSRSVTVRRNPRLKLVKKATSNMIVGSFRAAEGPLADARVRRALNLGIDKADLIRYGVLGNGRPLASLIFPSEPGYDPALVSYPYDPARAKRLLAEAGHPRGFTLKTLLKATASRPGKIIAAQLARIGVRLELHELPDAVLFDRVRQKSFDMAIVDISDPMLHPFFIQAILMYSKSPYALSRDPEYDARLERMSATLDPAEQAEAMRALGKHLHDQALALFVYQTIRVHAMARDVRFEPYRSGMPYFFDAERAAR